MDRTGGGTPAGDGAVSFLPPFANDKNRELDVEIQGLQLRLEGTVLETQEHQDRIQVMLDHLKNVQQELGFTQNRVEGKRKEVYSEEQMKKLAELSSAKLREELRALDVAQRELAEKSVKLQGELLRSSEKMDVYQQEMKKDKEELEQWAIASRQKEDDNLSLEKYKYEDESRIKELRLALEKVAADIARRRNELGSEVTDTQAVQSELDRAADEFRKAAAERSALVVQYDQACDAMARRDAAIQAAAERFAEQRAALRTKQALLDRRAADLARMVAANKDLDERISRAERGASKLRDTSAQEMGLVSKVTDESESARNGVSKAKSTLAGLRKQLENARAEEAAKEKKLESARSRLERAMARLEQAQGQLISLEERSEEVERLMSEEERRMETTRKELVELKERAMKQQTELAHAKTTERDLLAEISGAQSQSRALAQKAAQLDALVLRQQENLYTAEYQEVVMRRKVSRAQGERSEDEKVALNARIEELTLQLEERAGEVAMLTASVRRAEDDLSAARKRTAENKQEVAVVEAQLHTLALECDSVSRAMRAAAREKEDKMVSHDLLALDVRRVREALNTRVDEVFNLENEKLQLQLTVEERRHEVELHREVLRAQIKGAQEEVHRVTLELRERAARVDRLQNKYDILVARMKSADGEQHSQAYYIIKAAQEREELQRTGDELDVGIQKAEKEVRALEAALVKLGSRNDAFKASLQPAVDADAMAEREGLRERLDRAYDAMKFRRGEERALQADLEQARAKMGNLVAEEAALGRAAEELARRVAAAERDAAEQAAKQARAEQRVTRLARAPAASAAPADDFQIAEMRESNKAALAELRALAGAGAGSVAEAILEAGLTLQPSTASEAGSRAASRASTVRTSVSGGSVRSVQSTRSMGGGGGGGRAVQPRTMGLGGGF